MFALRPRLGVLVLVLPPPELQLSFVYDALESVEVEPSEGFD